MLSGLSEGLSSLWFSLDRALHPLYVLALLAFLASAVAAMWFSVAHRAPQGSRHPLARLEILWTLLTAMLVLGLATDSLRGLSHGPVQLAALTKDSYVDEPEPGTAAPSDQPADAADGGADALGEAGDRPTDAPADDGAQPSGDAGLPTDQEPADAATTVE